METLKKLYYFWKNYFLHAFISFFLCYVCYAVATVNPLVFVCTVVFGIGVTKEIWDYYNPPHCCDIFDVVADVIGIVLFVLTICLYTIR